MRRPKASNAISLRVAKQLAASVAAEQLCVLGNTRFNYRLRLWVASRARKVRDRAACRASARLFVACFGAVTLGATVKGHDASFECRQRHCVFHRLRWKPGA